MAHVLKHQNENGLTSHLLDGSQHGLANCSGQYPRVKIMQPQPVGRGHEGLAGKEGL